MVAYSKGMPIGTPAPPFSLPGVDGELYTLESFRAAHLLVVIFTCNHCPYAQALEPRFMALAREYAPKGVAFVAINPNDAAAYPDDSFDAMKRRAKEHGFVFPYLRDESQAAARAYDAACTPDIFVFDRARTLRYNGRCDDNWKEAALVTRQDLRRALDLLLEERPLDFEVSPALGCSIKWKPAS
jgi:peroxiredoxin